MLKNPLILVCTDFSQESDYAMKSAENLRRRVGGRVHAIHVSDFPMQRKWFAIEGDFSVFSADFEISHLRPLKKYLQEQITRCEVECTSDVFLEQSYTGISMAIEKINPDLVMMGHKGRSLGPFPIGGTTAKIVASSHKPVLVIKKVLPVPLGKVAGLVSISEPMNSIITATEDFSFSLSANPMLISLFQDISVEYEKFKNENPELMLARIRQRITTELDKNSKCNVRVEISDKCHVANELVKILEEEHVDLAIMKRHRKELIEKMFIGSETRRVLELFTGNILVLPPSP